MKWPRVHLKPYDYVVIAVALLVIVAFSRLAVDRGGPAALVEIRSDQGDLVYALNEDRVIVVPGPLGDTILEIENGTVRFVDSPCRDKICVAAGALSASGQWAACLPNRVFVTVSAAARDESLPDIDGATF